MNKNEKMFSIMLRNANYFKVLKINKNINKINKNKYNTTTTSNIINEYNKLAKRQAIINTEIQLNKANSLYNRNNDFKKYKEYNTTGVLSNNNKNINNKKLFKKKLNRDMYHNLIKSQNLSNNQNYFYNDDTDHSSMETIKKILYSTDNKEVKNEKLNNLLQTTKLKEFPNLKQIINNLKKKNQKNEITLEQKKNSNNNDNNKIEGYSNKVNKKNGNNLLNKKLLNGINNKLSLKTNNPISLQSMKYLKTNNNYDFDNIDNSINISDEFNSILEEKDNIDFNNNIYNSNNNKYTFRKIHNNINININNNSNKNKNCNDIIPNIQINNRGILNNNKSISNNYSDIDNDNFDNEYIRIKKKDYFDLQEKIKELTEEIKNKNILINEYSDLAKKSKKKFELLVTNNNKVIEKIKKEANKQNLIYKSKILSLEKEKKNLFNKYLENKNYKEFLEGLLFNQNNFDDNIKIKNLEEIVKKLINDISGMKIELENKATENEKLKKIIIKYKDSKSFRAISNPRKNINFLEEALKIGIKNKKINENKNKNVEFSSNINLKSKIDFDKEIKS